MLSGVQVIYLTGCIRKGMLFLDFTGKRQYVYWRMEGGDMVWLGLVLMLGSCAFPMNTQGYAEKGKGMPLEEAWLIASAYEYQWEEVGYWKSPLEFERDGGGDCEDFAAYMMYLLGDESMMVVVGGRWGDHALVWYGGRILEPQVYGMYVDCIVKEWVAWTEVMGLATGGGSRGLTFR